MSMAEWISWHLKILDDDACCLLLTICWKIWGARNQKLWNNIATNPNTIADDANAFLTAWRSFHPLPRTRARHDIVAKWEKPPSGWLKVNTDAATASQDLKVGLGFIIRDSESSFVAAVATCYQNDYHPKLAEAISIREALKWLKGKSMDNVQIETDSLLVIQGLNKASKLISYMVVCVRIDAMILSSEISQ
nr:uncharacterized protein LOC109155154 [Ipomoea batatas]